MAVDLVYNAKVDRFLSPLPSRDVDPKFRQGPFGQQHEQRTLKTKDGEISFEEAVRKEQNMLQQLSYPQKLSDFKRFLLNHQSEIEAIVSHHLHLQGAERCQVTHPDFWINGSFNICIPVLIANWKERPNGRVLIRFPLSFKIGESNNPGNADEKLRCEAATYIWIQENCPDIPVPRLWGFAFSNGSSFTLPENKSIYIQWIEYLRRQLYSLLGFPIPSRYVCDRRSNILGIGYLLLDYIEDGEMLSGSWDDFHNNKDRRATLFRDLSRILLSLSRIPLQQIGSFTISDTGFLSLTNRPLTLQIHQLENDAIPTHINRDLVYHTTESYILDLLACHDSYLYHQLNAVNNESDCQTQMAVLTCVRSIFHHFIHRDFRRGPFVFTLTDIHPSNIFVDENWHITCLIDLEWACSLPMEMQQPPDWLVGGTAENLVEERLASFDERRTEFMTAFESEEASLTSSGHHALLHTHTMQKGWKIGSFFYFQALNSVSLLYGLFLLNIRPQYASSVNSDEFDRSLYPYWCFAANRFTATKVRQKEEYNEWLKEMFKTGSTGLMAFEE
ncbi:hypothetical protein MMC11_006568 [Xylographa trunciseda]|nr:hypothetical protein [Xylographa trunciseda]